MPIAIYCCSSNKTRLRKYLPPLLACWPQLNLFYHDIHRRSSWRGVHEFSRWYTTKFPTTLPRVTLLRVSKRRGASKGNAICIPASDVVSGSYKGVTQARSNPFEFWRYSWTQPLLRKRYRFCCWRGLFLWCQIDKPGHSYMTWS